MFVVYLSLHHGINADEYMTEDDARMAATILHRETSSRGNYGSAVPDTVFVFTEAACIPPGKKDHSGYALFTGNPDQYFREEFGPELAWSETHTCIEGSTRSNRQVLAVGHNFEIVSASAEWIPEAIRTPSASEYGVFTIRHRASKREFRIYAVYATGDPPEKNRAQIQWLFTRAHADGVIMPTFIGGDLNMTSWEPQFAPQRSDIRSLSRALSLGSSDDGIPCKVGASSARYKVGGGGHGSSGKVHIATIDPPHLPPSFVAGYLLDPLRKTLAPDDSGGNIGLTGGVLSERLPDGGNAGLGHNAVGVVVSFDGTP